MNMNEQKRVNVLERLLGGHMSQLEASASLGVTSRHLKRLKSKYVMKEGQGLIHGNRGRKPKLISL